jgi:uncharacterized membrane protein
MPSDVQNHNHRNGSMPSKNGSAGSSDGNYHHAQTVEELTQRNVQTIVSLEEAAKEQRTNGDRVADAISDFCGSMTFVWVHVIWFAIWIGANTLLPAHLHFDKFPFTFLTLVVSLEAIFLSTFILISQNHQTNLSERRNHLDLQINLLTEQENTKMLQLLERIAKHLDLPTDDDPNIRVLEEATRPDQLIEQIDEAVDETTKHEKANK